MYITGFKFQVSSFRRAPFFLKPETWNLKLSARDRGKEGDFVTVTEDCVATHIFMVDGGRGHRGKGGQAGNLAGDGVPELADSRAVRQLSGLFGTAGRVAKGGEVEKVHAHARGVYFHVVRLTGCPG
jgi:hypothetical protein